MGAGSLSTAWFWMAAALIAADVVRSSATLWFKRAHRDNGVFREIYTSAPEFGRRSAAAPCSRVCVLPRSSCNITMHTPLLHEFPFTCFTCQYNYFECAKLWQFFLPSAALKKASPYVTVPSLQPHIRNPFQIKLNTKGKASSRCLYLCNDLYTLWTTVSETKRLQTVHLALCLTAQVCFFPTICPFNQYFETENTNLCKSALRWHLFCRNFFLIALLNRVWNAAPSGAVVIPVTP